MCLLYKLLIILKERKTTETLSTFQILESVFRSKQGYNCPCFTFNKVLKNKKPEFYFDQSITQK